MAVGFGFLQGASLSAILGIILETVEQRAAEAQATAAVVAIECNSGADRVIAWVAPGWDETLDDATLLAVIRPAPGQPAAPCCPTRCA